VLPLPAPYYLYDLSPGDRVGAVACSLMKKTVHPPLHVNSVAELHQVLALPPPAQPLISLFELEDITCPAPAGVSGLVFGFYSIWLKQGAAG